MKTLLLFSAMLAAVVCAKDAPKVPPKAPVPPKPVPKRIPKPDPITTKADLTAFLDTKPSKQGLIGRLGAPASQKTEPEVLTFSFHFKAADPAQKEVRELVMVDCYLTEGRLSRWEYAGGDGGARGKGK